MIIGALSWFNESALWLTRTIASLARVCDHVVCVDGRYELFQHDLDWSPAPEAEAVLAAAEGVGVPLTLHVPRAPFQGNEVEKRNLLLRLAMVHTHDYEDWIFVVDADEYIVHVGEGVGEILSHVEEYVASCLLEEYFDPFTQLGEDGGVARLQPLPNTWRTPVRRFYRALPDLAYYGTHFQVGGMSRRSGWAWLDGPEKGSAYELRENLILRHENPRRAMLRREQASTYYSVRDALQIEDPDVVAAMP